MALCCWWEQVRGGAGSVGSEEDLREKHNPAARSCHKLSLGETREAFVTTATEGLSCLCSEELGLRGQERAPLCARCRTGS